MTSLDTAAHTIDEPVLENRLVVLRFPGAAADRPKSAADQGAGSRLAEQRADADADGRAAHRAAEHHPARLLLRVTMGIVGARGGRGFCPDRRGRAKRQHGHSASERSHGCGCHDGSTFSSGRMARRLEKKSALNACVDGLSRLGNACPPRCPQRRYVYKLKRLCAEV